MPPRRRAGDDTGDPLDDDLLDDDLDTVRVRPQGDEPIYWPGRGQVPTIIDATFVETPDPTLTPPPAPPLPPPVLPAVPPFAQPGSGRRPGIRGRNDWTALVIALVVSTVVMAACCLAGLALFSTTNPGG